MNPYLLFATVNDGTKIPITNLYNALNKGLEKVISTDWNPWSYVVTDVSIHLLVTYEEIANILQITNFFGSNDLAFSLESLAEDAKIRAEDYNNPKIRMRKSFSYIPANLESNRRCCKRKFL